MHRSPQRKTATGCRAVSTVLLPGECDRLYAEDRTRQSIGVAL